MPPTFAQLGVPEFIRAALDARGITEPFEIQAATIAEALDGRDVCGRAPTGSGKTLAFGIPLVVNARQAQPKRPTALVLAPTRELADQIATELRSFAGNVRVAVVYGGVGYGNQLKDLRRGVDILVACPGRLEDLLQQGALTLADVDQVVLDEADRMADMGFIPAVRRLLDQTRSDRQTVLFSATLDGDVAKLTEAYQDAPVFHEVGPSTPDITAASHVFWTVAQKDRREATAKAIDAVWPAIVFTRTRHGADRLAKQLGQDGIRSAAIHGGRSQNQRTRALDDFAKNKVHALIATDVAARGIHVDGVALVVHFDPPEDHKTYVHRSGRTARAGRHGVVLSLVQPDQVRDTTKTQRLVGISEPFGEADAGALRDLATAEGDGSETPILVIDDRPAEPGQGNRPGAQNPRRRRSGGGRRNGSSGGGSGGGNARRGQGGGGRKSGSGRGQSKAGTGAGAGRSGKSGGSRRSR